MHNFLAKLTANAARRLLSRKLAFAAACVFALGLGSSFATTAADGTCNAECERYCFSQFIWCGGFFNDHCYPDYVACVSDCGCDIGS
jgi:hypothetical protein